jgi:hypothetical protein
MEKIFYKPSGRRPSGDIMPLKLRKRANLKI